jgi:hypothetical protein
MVASLTDTLQSHGCDTRNIGTLLPLLAHLNDVQLTSTISMETAAGGADYLS